MLTCIIIYFFNHVIVSPILVRKCVHHYDRKKKKNKINIIEDNILKIVRALNINKGHGHDETSVRMIKICDESLVKPLSLIYKNCTDTGVFPDIWKKIKNFPSLYP